MAPTASPLPTREQQAHAEIGHTEVTPAVARTFVAAFLAFVLLMAGFEIARGSADGGASGAWRNLSELPGAVRTAASAGGGAWGRLLAVNRAVLERLHRFENALEDESNVGRLLRPPAQVLLASTGGAGNEQVYVGREGWLFYRPDVEYVTSPGFLDAGVRAQRERAVDEWADRPGTDPRAAILSLKQQLDRLGIALILVPTPVKPTIHPEMLSSRVTEPTPQNPDYDRLLQQLRADGVTVFDPTAALAEAKALGASQYLATDTHWRPEAMEMVAGRLADLIRETVSLPDVADPQYGIESVDVANRGDVYAMLDLPPSQTVYAEERVTLRRVLGPDSGLWRSSPGADVLLLGDSFSNIYSLESMGWGTSAGLAEQLSLALRRPLDRIVQNDAGAYATRELLSRAGPERLAGKKVVVWQFAARELAFGDWKIEAR